jgi:hypothetical protein
MKNNLIKCEAAFQELFSDIYLKDKEEPKVGSRNSSRRAKKAKKEE